jgi:hypothetical protein
MCPQIHDSNFKKDIAKSKEYKGRRICDVHRLTTMNTKVYLLSEPGYVILCVGNFTEQETCKSVSGFPMDGGSILLRNVVELQAQYIMSHDRKQYSSYSQM